MIRSQIRANADTLEEFSAGHFAFHPFTLLGGVPEAIRVFGGEAALDSLLESLNAAVFKTKESGGPGPAGSHALAP
jgi:type I restriction enzyme, R subunit